MSITCYGWSKIHNFYLTFNDKLKQKHQYTVKRRKKFMVKNNIKFSVPMAHASYNMVRVMRVCVICILTSVYFFHTW